MDGSTLIIELVLYFILLIYLTPTPYEDILSCIRLS